MHIAAIPGMRGMVLALALAVLANTYAPTRAGDPTPDGCKRHDCSLREAFSAANAHSGRAFKEAAGNLLVDLGYKRNGGW